LYTFNVSDFYRLHTQWVNAGRVHAGILLAPSSGSHWASSCAAFCICERQPLSKACETRLSSSVIGIEGAFWVGFWLADEFGRMPDAQVSISTRSGSNEFHGALPDSIGNEALNANDWLASASRLSRRVNDMILF